jgi:porin
MNRFGDECRGGMPFQIELSYHPNDSNEFFAKLGWAVDNGLNTVSPWVLAPWAADLEDDVKDINGSSRDYLLTAWYKYTQEFQNESTLGATIGIIDSTDYLDGNAYANDEHTQFMNEAFVNAGNYNLPSYDAGAALEFAYGPWTFNGLGMNITESDEGYNYNFWGAEIAYHLETALGAGNYRLGIDGTSSAFLDPSGEKRDSLLSYDLSFDQEFGQILGGFLRFTWQREDAAVDYKALYSGGMNFSGNSWRRDEDNIGIGYAYLAGGNQSVENTRVFEAYYRAVLNEYAAITADVQYMDDDLIKEDPRQDNPAGWIFGLRVTAEY